MLAGMLAIPAFSAPRADLRGPAQPGTINYVEGQASLNGQPLNANSVGSAMLAGQVLTTQNGRAEILLTPGVLLRIDHFSSVLMNSTDLANTAVTLQSGRAMVEADEVLPANDIVVNVDGGSARLMKNGIYEFNAATGQFFVFDGQADVHVGPKMVEVKGGHDLTLNEEKLKAHGFDKKAGEDDFYRWASLRSSYLAEANLGEARMYVAGGPGWYGTGWYWNPWFDAYTWIPGDGLFWSPFGWGFYSPWVVGYAPFYGGFGYGLGYYHHFGPAYRPPVTAARSFAGASAFNSGVRGGFRGGMAPAMGGGFRGGFGGGGFRGGRR